MWSVVYKRLGVVQTVLIETKSVSPQNQHETLVFFDVRKRHCHRAKHAADMCALGINHRLQKRGRCIRDEDDICEGGLGDRTRRCTSRSYIEQSIQKEKQGVQSVIDMVVSHGGHLVPVAPLAVWQSAATLSTLERPSQPGQARRVPGLLSLWRPTRTPPNPESWISGSKFFGKRRGKNNDSYLRYRSILKDSISLDF